MILFDDENMRVLYEQRPTSTLIVTFAPRSVYADGETFWARGPLEKLGFSAVGFMPKRSNWFAPAFMQGALDSLKDITSQYDRVILYGGSAGAYAAAKWSRRLGAHYSICLAPQWTIDPARIGHEDKRFVEYFTEPMQGMDLSAEDLGGEIFVFFDPYLREDNYNAQVLLALAPNVRPISCPYMHHTVTELFAGTNHVSEIIEACDSNAEVNLKRVAGRLRRVNKHRLTFLLAKIFDRRPALALTFFKQRSEALWDNAGYYLMLGDYINSRGRGYYAGEIFDFGLNLFPASKDLQMRVELTNREVGR